MFINLKWISFASVFILAALACAIGAVSVPAHRNELHIAWRAFMVLWAGCILKSLKS